MTFLHKIMYFMLLPLLLAGVPAWAGSLERVNVQRGELSLQVWDKVHTLSLKGEWFFFPKEHLTPQAFLERWRQNPEALRTVITGQRFREAAPDIFPDDYSFATYAMVLHHLPPGELALEGSNIYTSSRLQVFSVQDPEGSRIELSIGVPGFDHESSRPLTATDTLLPLRARAGESWVILIHASNFHHNWGGLWLPPKISDFHQAMYYLKFQDKLNYWLLGLIFFLAVYNIAFYMRRPEDRASLWLANFSFVIFARLLVLAEASTPLIPDSTWKYELTFKIIYATMILAPLLLLYFLKSCFPLRISNSWIKGLSIVFAGPVLLILFLPATFYGQFSTSMKLISLSLTTVCLVVLLRAVRAGEEGALISLSGLLFVKVGVILDVLNSYGFEFLPLNSTGIGMSAFIICQSQIVASRFASAFRRSEHLSRELQSEVDKQTRDIKSILAHIRQGIFTISPGDKKIDELHSEYLKQLTRQTHMSGQNLRTLILDRSQLSEERKNLTESSLDAALGEDVLNFEINASNLVRELEFIPADSDQKRIFELDWNPMLSKDQAVEKILVSIRDVTDLRSLEAQARQKEADMKIIMDLLRIPEDRFHRFIDKTLSYLQESRELVLQSREAKPDVVKRLFVNMHTIKGASRTYYLEALSSTSHEVEQHYAALQKQQLPWDPERLLNDLNQVQSVVEHYRYVSQARLGWKSSHQTLRLSRKEVEYSLEMLEKLGSMNLTSQARECLREAQRVLLENCYMALPTVIEECCRGLDSMARDLGKLTPFLDLAPSSIVLKDKGADLLHSLMTHLLRNSLDHGFEKPEERLQKGKAPQGRIRLWTDVHEPHLYLYYNDDGNGLNLKKLEQIGKKRGLLPESFTDQDTAELIFCSGLSTKDEVSEISGRGVGMDAVRSYLEEEGGFIRIQLNSIADREHVPFTLIMALPLHLCFLFKISEPRSLDVAG